MTFLTPALQSICLLMALIVYGCFSSPTPDSFGWAEGFIALLLLLSIRLSRPEHDHSYHVFSYAVLGYGLSVPLLTGLIRGHNDGDIIRDVVPFFYFMLPLFFGAIVRHKPYKFLIAVTGIGILFSVRTIFSYRAVLWEPSLWGSGPPADLLYLANSPEVLFSALFCIGQGGLWFMTKAKRVYGLAMLLISLLPIIAMALLMQRAGIGAVLVFVVSALGAVLYNKPKWGMIFFMIFSGLLIAGWGVVETVLSSIWQKTEIVGLNARAQEWEAVFDIILADAASFLFGQGWGGKIENPAVGGLSVNYTHSLISSLLLKTGLIGAFMILAGCFYPVARSFKRILSDQDALSCVVICASLFPLLISVFLYASYKSLGFGLILCVFLIFPIRKLEKNQ